MQVRLTDRFVDSAKPQAGESRTDYWDTAKGSRVGLRVSERSKVWLVMYRRNADGKKRRYKLGSYPALSLEGARKAALAIIARVEAGDDPAADRDAIKAESTFSELAADYLKRYAKANRRSWQEDERRLNASILPALGTIRASQVSEADVIRLHDAVTARGAPIEANRQIALIRRIYSWAMERRMLSVNPAEKLSWNRESVRERVLNVDEIVQLWHGLDTATAAASTRLALKLLLLTGQRAGEITGSDIGEIDLAARTWRIPKERTKNGKAHNVPLSEFACDLFSQAIGGRKSGPVFPARKGEGSMTRRALSRAIARNLDGLQLEHFTPHDLRRTVASQMAAAGIDRLVIGKVLNHASTDRDSVTGLVYDQHTYEPEKRRALEKWAERLSAIVDRTDAVSGKVVVLR